MTILSYKIGNSQVAILLSVLLLISAARVQAEAGFWRESEHKAISLSRDDPSGAIEMYRLALKDAAAENAPVEKRLGMLLHCGELLYYMRRLKEAAEMYDQGVALAQENDLKNWQARFLLMQCRNVHELCRQGLATTNDPAPAMKALELRPGDPNTTTDFHISCLQAIGEAYLDQKDYANAEKYLKKAVVESDRLPDAQERIEAVTRDYLQLRINQHRYADATKLLVASSASHPSEFNYDKEFYARALGVVDPDAGTVRPAVEKLLDKRDFAGLDSYAKELRLSPKETIKGRAPIDEFMAMVELPAYRSEEEWKDRLTLVHDWIDKSPKSVTAKVALANLLTGYAWKARGGGWASEVSEMGWLLMGKRLKEAWKVLYDATPRTPDWYSAAQRVALGQSLPRAPYDSMVTLARKEFPSYNTVTYEKSYWLQPKWDGKEGEAIRYIDDECSRRKGIDADVLYAQFAWNLDFSFENVIKDAGFDWPQLKRGMLELSRRHPKSLAVRGELAYMASKMGDSATALAAFPGEANADQPIKMRAKGYSLALEEGEKFQRDEKRPEAIAAYTKAITLDPKSGEAYLRRAELYVLSNKYEQAMVDINACLTLFPAWAAALAERSRLECSMESYPASIVDVEKCLVLNPTNGSALSTLGHDYDAMGDHQHALNVANYAVEADEQGAAGGLYYDLMDRGWVWSNAHQFDPALNDLNRGLHLRGEWSQIWAYLAYIYSATDQFDEAAQMAVGLSRTEKFAPRGNRLFGEMYRAGGQWTKALAAYEKSTSMEPTYAPGLWQRAIAETALGHYDSAEESLSKSVALIPTSAMAQSYLALILDLQGKSDAAHSHIAQAFSATPDFPMSYVNRARIELHHGDLTKSAADCEKALSLDPYCSDAYATASAVLTQAGKDEAGKPFAQAAKAMWWHSWPVPLPMPDKVTPTDITITMPTLKELKPEPFELATRDLAP